MKKNASYLIVLLVFLFAVSSCTPTPAVPAIPIETVFAATYSAILAQTAAAMPPTETPTPTASNTPKPTLTPFPSATHVVLPITNTPSPSPELIPTNITSGSGTVLYACNILNTSPHSGYEVKPGKEFSWTWQVENIGTKKWYPDTMFAKYASGAEFYLKKQSALGHPTDVGESGFFVIKLKAPKKPGTYTTTFSLKKGIHYFCYAKLKIIVKK